MYIIRDVFNTKPGDAKNLVKIFKKTGPIFQKRGIRNIRVLTDTVANYWTVVWEFEVDTLNDYFSILENPSPEDSESVGIAMEGYMKFVTGGHREIYKIE